MPRVVNPPQVDARVDCTVGGWWHARNGRILCDLGPRHCVLKEGRRRLCFVRQNQGDRMGLTAHVPGTGFCVDPIDRKSPCLSYPFLSIRCSDSEFDSWGLTDIRDDCCGITLAGHHATQPERREPHRWPVTLEECYPGWNPRQTIEVTCCLKQCCLQGVPS